MVLVKYTKKMEWCKSANLKWEKQLESIICSCLMDHIIKEKY